MGQYNETANRVRWNMFSVLSTQWYNEESRSKFFFYGIMDDLSVDNEMICLYCWIINLSEHK